MILIKANGAGRVQKNAVGFVWVAVYHVLDGRFSFDLSEFDRAAVDRDKVE